MQVDSRRYGAGAWPSGGAYWVPGASQSWPPPRWRLTRSYGAVVERDESSVVGWLLAGDPSIRWQAMESLLGSPAAEVRAERARVATEGWGAELLAHQDAEGTWAQALYSPKWVSTTYTMLLLRELGLPPGHPQAQRACAVMLDAAVGPRSRGGIGWASETCVAGLVLSILSAFEVDDGRLERFADHLLGEQMNDGGWNCQHRRGAHHASMNTTILALEALIRYERHRARQTGRLSAVLDAPLSRRSAAPGVARRASTTGSQTRRRGHRTPPCTVNSATVTLWSCPATRRREQQGQVGDRPHFRRAGSFRPSGMATERCCG